VRTATQVSSDKLRGGFYSPQELVDVALSQALHLIGSRENIALLEPSAGDGQFIRGLGAHPIGDRVSRVMAVELLPDEAAKAEEARLATSIPGRVVAASFLSEACRDLGQFDVAVGNPPFVRFQFVSPEDRVGIEYLARDHGIYLAGVSNLWIPVFLSALARLRDGGVFSFIIPAECFTGLSARVVRSWLAEHSTELHVDLFSPKSFPAVLQEVVVLSGRVTRDRAHGTKVTVRDHGLEESWRHVLDDDEPTWTGLLLRPEHVDALREATALPVVHRFGDVARLQVATVTGANEYFSLTESVRDRYELGRWSRPLLARIRHAAGLDFTSAEHAANAAVGLPAWLLDAAFDESSIAQTPRGADYIALGEQQALHQRYKCRIREPWYQVPVVNPGELMLSKRSHRYPRLIMNSAAAVTTDTIYQGPLAQKFTGRAKDVVGSFHNSLTLLSAEMFGRSFGGGVLELVPSEVRSLLVPVVKISRPEFARLDRIVRDHGADDERLVEATDDLIAARAVDHDPDLWRTIAEARRVLLARRLART
jgi:adenine-specific DNA-methyltransferase